MIDSLISSPGRSSRPPKIVIVLRGLPGAGKSHLAKLIKEKETEQGGEQPRTMSLDDYFDVDGKVCMLFRRIYVSNHFSMSMIQRWKTYIEKT